MAVGGELAYEIERAAVIAKPTFDREEWTWRDSRKPPTIPEISASIRSLVKDLWTERTASITSGRLLVLKTDIGIDLYLQVGGAVGDGDEILKQYIDSVEED